MPSVLENLFLLVAPFSLLIQIGLCVHVYKTGRPFWWIWILFMGSLLGCLAYLLIEILPELRVRSPRLGNTSWLVPKSVRLRRAREIVEDSPTVENKLGLAALFSEYDRKEEAAAVAAECPTGVFKADPETIAEVARHQLAVGKLAEAERLLAQADTTHNKSAKTRLDLLHARILLERQRYAEAGAALTPLVISSLGEAPRYYLALCHLGLGDRKRSLDLLADITKKYRNGGAIWRRAEKNWFKLAKQQIREIQLSKNNPVPQKTKTC